jgi:zinc transport system substrate-binding protein
MTALEADLAESLAPVRGRRFVVFHDAYRYFETAFGLEAVAALTDEPGEPIGGCRLAEVRARAEADGAVCVFADAQAPEGAVTGIARDLGLKPGVLDPLGAGLEPGVDSYAILLKRLAEAFRGCLAR